MNEKASADISSAKAITTGELVAFAEAVQAIFIRAYDGEGYLVWKKQVSGPGFLPNPPAP